MTHPGIITLIVFLFVVIILLLFAVAKYKADLQRNHINEIIIETLADQKESQEQFYTDLLKQKNDSIALLQEQVRILNNEVARMHGRGRDSFINQ
jgi:Tfp pilus assembly protein PilE